jgi:23S rRNA pseudouridine1911/1915/1917 synthase
MALPQPIILFEDNHLLIVDKPSGVLVQGDSTGDQPLSEWAKRYIKNTYGKPGDVFLGVVHRIDRPVSGVVVLARTSKALERMNTLFRDRKTSKIYWAVVTDQPPESGHLVHWLRKDSTRNKTTAYDTERPESLRSELSFRLLGERKGAFLLEVQPLTGRSHQIRAQLSAAGFPIRGDVKYGHGRPSATGRIYLHARRLEFIHPITKRLLQVSAALPKDEIWQLFSSFER